MSEEKPIRRIHGQIVPFGKYKGQPVEALVEDRNYVEWLTAQPWFREKFQPIYNVVINNFGEPSETPEHNVLQALFLDTCFGCALLESYSDNFARQRKELSDYARSAAEGFRAEESRSRRGMETCRDIRGATQGMIDQWTANYLESARKAAGNALPYEEFLNQPRCGVFTRVAFEVRGIDVRISWRVASTITDHSTHEEAGIEIKPVLADDYPAVLRQMKRQGATVLFTEAYIGVGATIEQVRQMFRTAGIRIVFRSEVEALIPKWREGKPPMTSGENV